jgi:RNA polymerase sigma factor (sigma-70 family)
VITLLTAEQKKMVEDNEKLIYFALNKYHFSIDEYYDAAAIGLCKAAQTYTPNKGSKFSSYAVFCIRNEIYYLGRSERKIQRFNCMSIDQSVEKNDMESMLQIPANDLFEPREDRSIATEAYKKASPRMTKKEKSAFDLHLRGIKQKQISILTGTSQAHISRLIKKAALKCAAAL